MCVCVTEREREREREREYEGADHNHGNIVRGHKGERARERCLTEGFEGLRNIQCVNENAWHTATNLLSGTVGSVIIIKGTVRYQIEVAWRLALFVDSPL